MTSKKNNWDQFALLLIDVQNDFWSEQSELNFPQFRKNVQSLLECCRREGIEVIHLRGCFREDKSDWMPIYKLGRRMPCIENTSGIDLLPEAKAVDGEIVLEKHSFDGFLNEELDRHLQQGNKRFLLTAGLITSVCVFLTTVSAMQRGYLTAIVEDCCADEPAAHEHTLDRYSFMFEKITVDELALQHQAWQQMIDQLET